MQPVPALAPTPPVSRAAALRTPRAVVIGGGVGGLVAAALLAHAGLEVQLLERAATPGGKMRQVNVGPLQLDGGPTVLTMRWVFDALFERMGDSLSRHLQLQRCEVLARHAWGPGEALDLQADLGETVARIAAFSSPAEGKRYAAFCRRAQQVYQTLERPFMCSSRPTPASLTWRVLRQQGPAGLAQLLRISPFTTLWRELGHYFHDPRLRQLFGRYATYCGSSPFDAPATLMLVAHVEREAVWQVEGGMARLGQALLRCAQQQGARVRCSTEARRIVITQGRASGVVLADGEHLPADIVVFNGDAQALATGLLGPEAQGALGQRSTRAPHRAWRPSLSALTWHTEAEASGFELSHHNVFFGPAQAYQAEFDACAAGRLPAEPTVYVCAQDRTGQAAAAPRGSSRPERLMCLVNSGAATAGAPLTPEEIATCEARMWNRLHQAGLTLRLTAPPVLTRPQDFALMFPGSGGALYGPASQGWRASFQARPAGRTPVPGLYLAGGSVHPGPGVPMAALSGQLAAEQILAGLASTSRWHPVATPGGMPMR